VAINVSGRTLGINSFAETILEVVERHQVEPSKIVLEITETALLDDAHGTAAQLERLRKRGIQIAIDDFGTGYTSLAHLRTLPFDILKVDQSYTSDQRLDSLLQLIIDTGHLLGATVTAEGVETTAQAARLTDMGSDHLQGFLYGKPCSASQLRARLSADATDAALTTDSL
jgi:EAL domain-containing protein (putative c-di-GMP-specific phosphodiesterase class I)